MLPETGWAPPPVFDDYRVLRPLGRGGMGHVYLGHDEALDRPVALKFIASAEPSDSERERFLAEARAIARLAHPNVVAVFRVGETERKPYIAYELVRGRTFHELRGPLAWQVALTLGSGLARGLEAVHRAGLVHRDLKPSNVILADGGEVKLIDFGLAKSFEEAPASTRAGTVVGTPAFLAPELWTGATATPRSDIFAFGLVLHELLLGAGTRSQMSVRAVARATLEDELPPVRKLRPEIPETFAAIVDRCLRKNPDERFASAIELRESLDALHAVFLPRAHHAGLPTVDSVATEVASSFARVAPRLDAFSARLYDRLFDQRPRLRAQFPDDMREQREKLGHAIGLVVDGLQRPERLGPAMTDLGRRHLGYGVAAEDLAVLGDVLLDTLREFDAEAWNESADSGWRRAWSFVHDSMVRGYEVATLGSVIESTALDSAPPQTRYAKSDGLSLAWQELGDGRPIVVLHGFTSHVELAWRDDALASFLRRLAKRGRLVAYDKRGVGLSDRGVGVATLDEHVRDLRAVLDAARVDRALLVGAFDGAAIASAFAAAHPQRVEHVVAVNAGGFARDVEMRTAAIDERWGGALFIDEDAPSRADDPRFRAFYAEWLRLSASARDAIAALRAAAAMKAQRSDVPTTCVRRAGDRRVSRADAEAHARALDARFVEVDGGDHLFWTDGAADVIATIEATRVS